MSMDKRSLSPMDVFRPNHQSIFKAQNCFEIFLFSLRCVPGEADCLNKRFVNAGVHTSLRYNKLFFLYSVKGLRLTLRANVILNLYYVMFL